jgi:hypothetical protein
MPKVTTLPRQRKGSSPQFGWREARFQVKQFEYLNSAQVEEVSKNAFKEKFQSLLRA